MRELNILEVYGPINTLIEGGDPILFPKLVLR